ncbi:MAG: arginine--tRNA ligase [Gammaproteobacteria bacterium]|nr:arginine--tRNA ligase [Gammaproteobacteria bacterium]
MKAEINSLIAKAIESLKAAGTVPAEVNAEIVIDRTKDKSHGDFACNIAMRLAKPAGKNPRELAQALVAALPASPQVEKVEIAGPGFINFYLTSNAAQAVIATVLAAGENFGRSQVGAGQKVILEFVSANPTGPLHVGHGRGAAYGAVVANLLTAAGFNVHKEYYVNDAGRQMDILAASVWLRYLELCGETVKFPSNGYKGDYIVDISRELRETHGDQYRKSFAEVLQGVHPDEGVEGGDKEEHIDGIIARCKELLGHAGYRAVFGVGLNNILTDIRDDLAEFGVTFDEWFSERSLMENGAVPHALEKLQASKTVYEQEGALWFRSTDYGDEKDRVVQRDNGLTTYFASDIAYHLNKCERGFDKLVDIWGADHHGYVPRVRAGMTAMGQEQTKLDVLLVQFAILYRGGERVQMSTRSGSFVTLRELRDEVGNDAARFFYVMRKSEQHLDFDLDLAKSQSNDNPVYYIQYAHARICSVLRELNEKNLSIDAAKADLAKLDNEHEAALLTLMAKFPEVVENAAINYEPHQLPHYLRELANALHSYYNAHKFIVDDEGLRNARLQLVVAVRQILQNGLRLIGVSAPEAM